MIPHLPDSMLVLLAAGLLSACGSANVPPAASHPKPATLRTAPMDAATNTAQALPPVEVFKSPACGCCGSWIDHLRQAGFPVQVHEVEDLEPVRKRLGVPYGKGSCHTARVDGYVIEGHVPAADIQRLLRERPDARGLVLPGMPAGSPGMETADGYVQPHAVERVADDGTTSVWSRYGK